MTATTPRSSTSDDSGDERLPHETQEATASTLADRARRRELALFLGAGVSASAGLPLWGELLDRLLAQAGVDAEEAAAIAKLDARDAATLAVRKLTSLPEALRAILTPHRYGLAHALLAALPVDQTVTTNYDQLFETARGDQRRPVAVCCRSRLRGRRGCSRSTATSTTTRASC